MLRMKEILLPLYLKDREISDLFKLVFDKHERDYAKMEELKADFLKGE